MYKKKELFMITLAFVLFFRMSVYVGLLVSQKMKIIALFLVAAIFSVESAILTF